jgi:hypothetical protein|tara:strand:+ start:453 stop:629 length:177 start_codon:yes stop_codon:yes gene_type:complete
MAKSKLIDEVIQEDVVVSEEVVAEVKKAVAPKDAYAIPEIKEEDKPKEPGHSRRDFRN